MYPNKTIEKAFKNFKKENTTFDKQEVKNLNEALKSLSSYKPSEHLKGRWKDQWGHVALVPDQLVRDMLIVDYMVQQKNMEFTSACDIWNKWEGYEFALLEDRGDDYYNNCMN